MDLSNRVAMVTGAAQGIGKATALVLAKQGANIVATDVKEEKVNQTVAAVQTLGRQAMALSMDVRIKNHYGKIINVSSIASKTGEYGNGAYCVSKAGVSMLTQVQALELEPHNINVNAVCPGFSDTEFLYNAFKTRDSDGTVSPENYQRTLI